MKNLRIICLLILSLSLGGISFANDQIDAMLNDAAANMYANPKRTIQIGDSLLNLHDLSDETKIKVLLAMVSGYSGLRDYEKSVESAKLAENLITNYTPLETKIRIYQVMGSQYHGLKLYAQAIAYFEKADLLIDELAGSESLALFRGYNNVSKAFIYRDQMGCDVALEYFEKAVSNYRSSLKTTGGVRNLSTTYYNKGNCEFALQMVDSAEKSYKAAIEYAETTEASSLVAFAQKGLAMLYTSNEQYSESLALLEKALGNAQGIGDLVLNQAILRAIADNYLALGDYAQYDIYSRKTGEIQSIIVQNQRKSVTRTLDDLVAGHNATIEKAGLRQALILSGAIAGIAAFLLLALRLYRRGLAQRMTLRNRISALHRGGV